MSLLAAARALRDACDSLETGVPYVYNPLRYAWNGHAAYLDRYGAKPRRTVLVGMNPGPHGMAQTGVPFGDVTIVRDWMGIIATHEQPANPHPKRRIDGFACTRREPSGSRLYGWARERYGSAEAFFGEFFLVNHCPLLFFDEAGKNLTPPQLGRRKMEEIYALCDEHLAAVVQTLRPQFVVGVGAYATERAQLVVDKTGHPAKVGTVLHPSPASPAANKGWAPQAEAQLRALGVLAG